MKFFASLILLSILFSCSYTDRAVLTESQTAEETQVLAFVGDVLLHQRLRHREEKTGEGYRVIWSGIDSYLSTPDISYANIEGPVAPELGGASGYPLFNFPVKIISDLKDSGFDVVSTANNHALDRSSAGVELTIANLRRYGMPFTGTIKDKSDLWWTVVKSGETQVAFLSCTEHLNGHADRKKQVLLCYEDKNLILDLVRDLAKRADISMVVLLPHWGEENALQGTSKQRNWAHEMIDAGAAAVVGAHPHVIQPIESYTSQDGRVGWICYSLGNFISNQPAVANKLSMIFYLKIRLKKNGPAIIAESRALPLWIDRSIERDGTAKYRLAAVWDFSALPAEAAKIWTKAIAPERNFRDRSELENFLNN